MTAGGTASVSCGVDSEIGRLQTVLVHRPGPELKRIAPHARGGLLFDTLPWASRAQQEHDAFARALHERGVEVLYVTELLEEALEGQAARDDAVAAAVADPCLGDSLRGQVRAHLESLDPGALARALVIGLARQEFRAGRGLVYEMLDRRDFVLEPLPNMVFVRDSSVWVGSRVAVAGVGDPARRRESELIRVIYTHHPRFAPARRLCEPGLAFLAGGDVLHLGPGVVAVGVRGRAAPAEAERLARGALADGLAHAVLAVPLPENDRLDTVCAVVGQGAVMMRPGLAYTLRAHVLTSRGEEFRVSRPRPFLEAAAEALRIDAVTVVSTGADSATGAWGPWDERGNALMIGPGVAVCHERNVETRARLEALGVDVAQVPGSELASGRGGPRCMTCPVRRDPAGSADGAEAALPARPAARLAESAAPEPWGPARALAGPGRVGDGAPSGATSGSA